MRDGEGRVGDDSASAGSTPLLRLCAGILEHIGAYVFTGEFIKLRPQLEEARSAVNEDLSEPAAVQTGDAVRAALSLYSRELQEIQQSNAVEMAQMVGVLGHALTVLTGGNDRAVSRLRRIQSTVDHTASIQDLTAIRASLRDIVRLIGEETSKEQQAAMREREGLETQVVRFRERLAGNPNRRMQGREEAIRAIADSLAANEAGRQVWVISFVIDQLKAIVQRYGTEAVDDLLLQLIRERLQPVAPSCTAFRWSPSALVGVALLETDAADLNSKMARLNQTPLVGRIALGSRTAVLKVGLSHLVLEVKGSLTDRSLNEIDRFTGFEIAEVA